MLVVMKAHATEEQVRAVCERIELLGYRAHPIPGAQRTAIGVTGNKGALEQGTLGRGIKFFATLGAHTNGQELKTIKWNSQFLGQRHFVTCQDPFRALG